MQDYSLFAKRLYQERKKNKLTQKELAQKMGVSQGAISRIEKGLLIPSLDMFIQLSNTLNCSPNLTSTSSNIYSQYQIKV